MRFSHLILLLLLCATACRPSGTRTGHVAIEHQTEYATVAASMDSTRIRQSIVHLAGFGSRMTGYPGADAAAQYLMDQFTVIGLEEVKKEEFTASVPLDEGGELTILDPTPSPAEGKREKALRSRGAGEQGRKTLSPLPLRPSAPLLFFLPPAPLPLRSSAVLPALLRLA